MLVTGFDAVIDHESRILILGTLPGRRSLELKQYYADSRNVFWFIAERLFGIDQTLRYEHRLDTLLRKRIAIWDVLRQAEREGSSDGKIARGSEVANNFSEFFGQYPSITDVFFNGDRPRKLFSKLVAPKLGKAANLPRYDHEVLVSSSNAYTRDKEWKSRMWAAALQVHEPQT
jgi:hypoxanthine-DNA glycosylase